MILHKLLIVYLFIYLFIYSFYLLSYLQFNNNVDMKFDAVLFL